MEKKIYKEESKNVLIIHTILAIIIILFLNKGIYTYIDRYIPNIVIILIFGIWMIISLLTDKKYIESLIKVLIPLISFMVIMKVSSFFTNNTNLDMYLSNLLYILIMSCIAIYYIELNNKKINKVILTVLLIDTIYVGINTYIQLLENPMIARFLSTGIETRSKLVGDGNYLAIGSYTYFYSLVMIILILINYILIKKDDKFLRVIVMMLIIFLIISIIQAQFMISILLLTMCILLMIVNNVLKKSKNKQLVLIAILIIFMLLIVFLPNILKEICNFENIPDLIKVKIEEIYNVITQTRRNGRYRFKF